MVKKLVHTPAVRQRLRRWRPLYNAVFRRSKDLSRLPEPAAEIRAMGGRGVFMFAFGRCGTTVFADFLASHPQVTTFGEVLNQESYFSYYQALSRGTLRWWSLRPDLMRAEFYRFLARLVRRNPGQHCLFDLKIEGLHMIEGNWRLPGLNFDIFDVLLQTEAPVILVERRDLVARHVSGRIAAHRGKYHSYHGAGAATPQPFAIDIERMEADNTLIRAQLALIKRRFADHPAFAVVAYEDMFEPADDGTTRFAADLGTRMAALLGIADRFDRVPRLQKVTGGNGAVLILNRSAVEDARRRQQTRDPQAG